MKQNSFVTTLNVVVTVHLVKRHVGTLLLMVTELAQHYGFRKCSRIPTQLTMATIMAGTNDSTPDVNHVDNSLKDDDRIVVAQPQQTRPASNDVMAGPTVCTVAVMAQVFLVGAVALVRSVQALDFTRHSVLSAPSIGSCQQAQLGTRPTQLMVVSYLEGSAWSLLLRERERERERESSLYTHHSHIT